MIIVFDGPLFDFVVYYQQSVSNDERAYYFCDNMVIVIILSWFAFKDGFYKFQLMLHFEIFNVVICKLIFKTCK